LLLDIVPEYQRFIDDHGTYLVQLDKAMYGCVEAVALWFDNLNAVLVADGFVANPHDFCVFACTWTISLRLLPDDNVKEPGPLPSVPYL